MELILAPLAEITSTEFRKLCYEGGADRCYSEMISAKALTLKNKKTFKTASVDTSEPKTFIQFFGSDPEIIKDAVSKVLENTTPYGIDINAGCPVKKVVKQGAGSALMDDPAKLGAIVKAVRSVTQLPLSVKIRKGFKTPNYLKCALVSQENGADELIIHPRLRTEMFSGLSDYKVSLDLAKVLDIPVIHSGDIRCAEDLEKFEGSGVKGAMIGRGVLGAPWIFDILKKRTVEKERKRDMMIKHFLFYVFHKDKKWAHTMMRRHASWYSSGKNGSAEFRNAVFRPEKTVEDTVKDIKNFFKIKL